MQYTIKAVSQQTRQYQTKFGDMISYKVMFEGEQAPVEISQKAATPPPKEGDVVDGTIDTSGQYGPKFKKEFSQGGFGGGSSSTPQASRGVGKFNSDPFTMYLSYAKDVAVALIASKNGYDAEKFAEILDDVVVGGKTLYGSRPGAEPEQSKDVAPSADADPKDMNKEIIDFFGKEDEEDDKPIDTSSIPF